MFGRADKLDSENGYYIGYTSPHTKVTYIGDCTHRVQSGMNSEADGPIILTYDAIVKNILGSDNWQLQKLVVKSDNNVVLLHEDHFGSEIKQ